MSKPTKQLWITVGTTKFEKWITAIDTDEFYETCNECGFTKIIIQKGSGEYLPSKYKKYENRIQFEVATIWNNFETLIKNSEWIISHGGAGIIWECLKNKRKVIVCVNDSLMDNHQVELAASLDAEGYVHYAKEWDNLGKEIKKVVNKEKVIKEYPEFNYDAIPNVIYSMLDI